MNRAVPLALPLLALWLGRATPARADEFHFEDFRYGQRALGMGGAVTGLAVEPGAAWYNPAGLARLEGAEFSGALTFVGFESYTLRSGLRDEGYFQPEDMTASGAAAEPSYVVASATLGRHALALTTFLASDRSLGFSGRVAKPFDAPGGRDEVRFTLSDDRSARQLMRGITYAFRASGAWALGVSAYWVAQTRSRRLRRSRLLQGSDPASVMFLDLTTEERTSTDSVQGRLGVLWTPAGPWSAGVACTSPSVPLAGQATYGQILADSGDRAGVTDALPTYVNAPQKAEAQTVLPGHCRVGGAWQGAGWTVSADLSVVLPMRYQRFNVADGPAGLYLNDVTHELTVNAAVGVEFPFAARWPMRAGLFTNRTSAPSVPALPKGFYEPHVDRYGATWSMGYLGDKRSINFGLEAQMGAGHSTASASLERLDGEAAYIRLEREEWRVVFFVAGAAAFASSASRELLDLERLEQRAP